MGLVQKIFYYHMPSAWMFLTAAIVCGIASARFLATGDPRHDRTALAAAEMAVLFGLLTLVTGPLWARKAWGTWWIWDARTHVEPGGLDDRVGLPDPAAVRRSWFRETGGRTGTLRDGQRAVHLHVGQLLADDSPGDDGRAEAAVLDGISALVLPRGFLPADVSADEAPHACGRTAGCAWTRSIFHWTNKRDGTLIRAIAGGVRADDARFAPLAAQSAATSAGRVHADRSASTAGAIASRAAARRRIRLRPG